ncbi:MAG: UDP-N-acetylmuramoyl-tripeptide--D-alanyl-D-alanine ligase [Clostridia bacterium]|nr:UDP-N-acetylmuramoyl-tripeptide--D-alanyl-D-alanine ligase [Clostridia bacterium]
MRIRLGSPLSLCEVTEIFQIPAPTRDAEFQYITTDSREAMSGDLFVSLSEIPIDSLKHTAEARERGAVTLGAFGDLRVKDTSSMLLRLANYYKRTRLTALNHTVAITGSVGKTTTKEFAKSILGGFYKVHASPGNYNNRIGLPLAILTAKPDTEILLLECGMNAVGEISELSNCIEPDIAVITNIGTSHIGNLGSREAIAKAKLEILDGMSSGVLIRPLSEPLLESNKKAVTFSVEDEGTTDDADYTATNIQTSDSGIEFVLHVSKYEEAKISFPLTARHLIPDLLAAVAAVREIGMPLKVISEAITDLGESLVRHRFIDMGRFTLLDDSYNSSLESARSAIDLLLSRPATRHTAVFGDILELGTHSKEIHRALGRYAAGGVDRIIAYGEFASYIKEGALARGMSDGQILVIGRDSGIEYIREILNKTIIEGELILIKGSNRTGLWKLSLALRGEINDG